MLKFYANGVEIASPIEIKDMNENIVWSSNAGRGTTALFNGDWVGEKLAVSLEWHNITKAELKAIRDNMSTKDQPFKMFKIVDTADGEAIFEATVYRGVLTKVPSHRYLNGKLLFDKVSTDLVEQ